MKPETQPWMKDAAEGSTSVMTRNDFEKAYAELTKAANEEGEKLTSAVFSDNDRHLMLMERYRGRADIYLEMAQGKTPAAAHAPQQQPETWYTEPFGELVGHLQDCCGGCPYCIRLCQQVVDEGNNTADVKGLAAPPVPDTPGQQTTIDEQFAGMATDPAYVAEAAKIAREFECPCSCNPYCGCKCHAAAPRVPQGEDGK